MHSILTAKQREQLILFLRKVGKDPDCYFVGEKDRLFYICLSPPQEPIWTSDAVMLELALARAGLGLEYGVVYSVGYLAVQSSVCAFKSFCEQLVNRVGDKKRVDEVLGRVFPPEDSEVGDYRTTIGRPANEVRFPGNNAERLIGLL